MKVIELFLPGWGTTNGIDDPAPVIGWKLAATTKGERQAGFRVTLEPGGIDSGWIEGTEQRWTPPLLAPLTAYRAELTVRGAAAQQEEQVGASLDFSTGPMSPGDWDGARWIAHPGEAAPQLRREFTVAEGGRAWVHVACAGFAVVAVNGERVSGANDPGFPYYPRSVLFRTYPVDLLPGANVVTITLARGWWGVRSDSDWDWKNASWTGDPRVKILLTGAASLVSDNSWRAATGCVRYDDVLYGELHDTRLTTAGWREVGFDDSGWPPATEVRVDEVSHRAARHHPEPQGALLSAVAPPSSPEPGYLLHDFGIVTTGTARVVLHGKPGARVAVVHGEKLDRAGRIVIENAALQGSGHEHMTTMQTDVIVLSGGEDEAEAELTFKGCRYVAVHALDGDDTVEVTSVRLREILSAMPRRARFSCSDPQLVTLFEMSVRSLLINQHAGLLSDTPTYEKNGWLGDAVAMLDSATLALDMSPLLRQWHDQILDAFEHLGFVPVIVPPPPRTPEPIERYVAPEWASAVALFVIRVDELHGDTAWAAQSYERVRAAVEWILALQRRGRWSSCYGDWGSPAGNNRDGGRDSSATAHTILAVQALGRLARRLGREEDAERYDARAAAEASAWGRRLWDAQSGTYRPSRRYPRMAPFKTTPTLLAHALGIEPAAHGARPLDRVAQETELLGHLNVGIVGEPLLLPLLHDHGRADLCLHLLRSTARPSWGQWASLGATTTWNGWGDPAQIRSLSHHMHGSYLSYLLTHLAGIRPVGSTVFDVQPSFLLDELDAALDTGHGEVRVAWDRETLTIEVPVGVIVRHEGRELPSGITTTRR